MAAFDRMYTSSPVLALPPQSAHHHSFLDKPFQQHHGSAWSQTASWPKQLVRTSSVVGRKRSRDEAAVNLDSPEKVVEAPKEPEDEWVFGPGMILIKKTNGYVAGAGSQSGTWVEERAAKEQARKAEAARLVQDQLSQSRPSLRSHKSQRLQMPTAPLNPTETFRNNASSPSRNTANPLSATSDSASEPIVDDFTLHLGIGWSRISDQEHIQAAARGWARFIENHYPVTNAKIRLESRGLQSYLVESDEGFFLFAENLRQGRLVSKNVEGALQNLKASPVIFDGPNTMEAAETPKTLENNTLQFTTPAPASVEMDMS